MSILSKKARLLGVATVALVTLVGGSTYAYVSWQAGHDNLQATSENIDTLVGRINSLKAQVNEGSEKLVQLDSTNRQLSQQLDQLTQERHANNTRHQQELNQKIVEINNAIEDGNTKVAQVQRQVEEKQSIINELMIQLEAGKQHTNQLDQALIDAQNVRIKSDQAVEQTK